MKIRAISLCKKSRPRSMGREDKKLESHEQKKECTILQKRNRSEERKNIVENRDLDVRGKWRKWLRR